MKLKLEIDFDYEVDEYDLGKTLDQLINKSIIEKVQWHPDYRAMVAEHAVKLLEKLKEK